MVAPVLILGTYFCPACRWGCYAQQPPCRPFCPTCRAASVPVLGARSVTSSPAPRTPSTHRTAQETHHVPPWWPWCSQHHIHRLTKDTCGAEEVNFPTSEVVEELQRHQHTNRAPVYDEDVSIRMACSAGRNKWKLLLDEGAGGMAIKEFLMNSARLCGQGRRNLSGRLIRLLNMWVCVLNPVASLML